MIRLKTAALYQYVIYTGLAFNIILGYKTWKWRRTVEDINERKADSPWTSLSEEKGRVWKKRYCIFQIRPTS